MAINTVKAIRDYDGYFEREAKDIAAEIPQLGYEIIVEAGPYKSCDVSYKIDTKTRKSILNTTQQLELDLVLYGTMI